MATRTHPTTLALYENLGTGIRSLVEGAALVTYEDHATLGRQIAAMVRAAVKSALPGRQSNKQVTAIQQAAQQAFARALARKVKRLEA